MLSPEDRRVMKALRISEEAFVATRALEEAERAARARGSQADADEAVLRRMPNVSRSDFLEERRREQAERAGRATARAAAAAVSGGDGRKKISLTADEGQLASLLADREARRHARL